MGDLFKRNMQYGDDREAIVGLAYNNYFESRGEYSENVGVGNAGAVSAMYDGINTTIYTVMSGGASLDDCWVKWDFGRRTRFMQLYAYVHHGGGTVKLQGSNDDLTYTDIDTVTLAAAGDSNLAGSVQVWRYIRIYQVGESDGQASNLGVYTVQGVPK